MFGPRMCEWGVRFPKENHELCVACSERREGPRRGGWGGGMFPAGNVVLAFMYVGEVREVK